MNYTRPVAYDRFMGRWSARLAPSFLQFSLLRGGQHILDVGCGTGNLARAALSFAPDIRVTGIDPAPEYVAFARNAVPGVRVKFQRGAAEALPFADRAFDAALALLVVQDFADKQKAVAEMARVTRAGGIIAACQWDFEQGLPMLSLLWQAAEAVAPDAVAARRAVAPARHSLLAQLEALWRNAGIAEVTSDSLEFAMRFESFEDYWQPFLGGSTPTSSFAAAINAQTGGALERVLRRSRRWRKLCKQRRAM